MQELKGIIISGQYQVYKVIDNIKVQTYWRIGERIVREEIKNKDRADYGKYLINNLATDLGMSRRLLHQICKFYRVYPIVHALRAQLSWRHYVCLLALIDEKERLFYQNQVISHSWSYRNLNNQIKNHLYQKIDQNDLEEILKTKLPVVVNLQKIFKPDYDFNFLEIMPKHREKELEDRIILNIDNFLKELGGDFLFLGRQVPTLIDNQKHFVDLVLYHRGIPCVVLVDLKVGKLDSRDIGQMNKYINYYRTNKQYTYEQETIGLIICRELGHEEVIYALGGLEDKIFVSIYKTKLPSEDQIKLAICKF